MSDSVRPHRWQPTRLPRPWDSPGKNTGVGSHFLLQCMKVKSEREVTQSCPTLSDPMDGSPPGSSVRGIFQARVLEWGAIAFYLVNPPNFLILILQSDPERRQANTSPCSRHCSKPIKYTNSFNSCNNPLSCELLLSPFYRQGSQGLGRFSNLARVTQQALRQKKDLRLKLRASEECGL